MKTLILSSIMTMSFMASSLAQAGVSSRIYQQYADDEDVLSMSLNYDLIDILDLDIDVDDQLRHLSGDVYQVKFLAFGDEAAASKTLKAIDRELAGSSLELLEIPAKAEDEDFRLLKFYGYKKGGYYSDVCMLLLSDDGETGVFIAVYGKIKIRRAS